MARTNTASTSNHLTTNGGGVPVSGFPVTMACWFQSAATTLQMTMGLTSSSSNSEYLVLWLSGGKVRQGLVHTVAAPDDSAGTYTTNTWHHQCGVATASAMTSYLDGVAGTPAAHSVGFPSVNTLCTHAMDRPSLASALNGAVAWPAVWNVALSAEEIAALAAGAHPFTIRPGNLVFFSPFSGESAGGEPDLIGALDLTEVGTIGTDESPMVTIGAPIAVAASAASTLKTITDTGTGADAIAQIAVALGVTDSGAGADGSPAAAAAVPLSDSGVGADALGLAAALGLTDAGVGSDSITGISVSTSIAESATGADALAIAAALALAETASGADAITVVTEILKTVADAASGADAITITVQASIAETASGADTIAAIAALVALADSGAGVDAVVRFDASTSIAHVTCTLRQRAAVFSLAQRRATCSLAQRTATFSLAA